MSGELMQFILVHKSVCQHPGLSPISFSNAAKEK